MALSYLTVQDVLWINLQLTGKVQHYQYARLEEATFYQYAYGGSGDLLAQAGRFAAGFVKLHPFDAGNEATGLIALIAFLNANGRAVKASDKDLVNWFESLQNRDADLNSLLESSTTEEHGHHEGMRDLIRCVIDSYPKAIESLLNASATA